MMHCLHRVRRSLRAVVATASATAIAAVVILGPSRVARAQIVTVVRAPARIAARRPSADTALVQVVHPTTQLTELSLWVDSAAAVDRLEFERAHAASPPPAPPAHRLTPPAGQRRAPAAGPAGRSADRLGGVPSAAGLALVIRPPPRASSESGDVELRRAEIVQ